MKYLILLALFFVSQLLHGQIAAGRGEVTTYQSKFMWSGNQQAFVPNFIMFDVIKKDLIQVREEDIDDFIQEFIVEHGFNGVHLPVYGQWFHLGENKVTETDSIPDEKTFNKVSMIIQKVYEAGGCTYIWLWGDHGRKWTSKSTKDGIMGSQEKRVLDRIANRLGPLPGWMIGYGFDLWEWVSEDQLREWHDYMWKKQGWNHLLGARSSKNELTQLYEGMDFSSYEFHKPWYPELTEMIAQRPDKPSMSADRYRVRNDPPSKWPEKDYSEDETLKGLWHHIMAGGIGAIWGKLDGDGIYTNKEALKCFSIFWNDKNRFRKDMRADNSLTDGYCLRQDEDVYVFYKENTGSLSYSFLGDPKTAIAVDTRSKYKEISLGTKQTGQHIFNAPYSSDWAIVLEE